MIGLELLTDCINDVVELRANVNDRHGTAHKFHRCDVICENPAYGGKKWNMLWSDVTRSVRRLIRIWTFCHIWASVENTFFAFCTILKSMIKENTVCSCVSRVFPDDVTNDNLETLVKFHVRYDRHETADKFHKWKLGTEDRIIVLPNGHPIRTTAVEIETFSGILSHQTHIMWHSWETTLHT